MSACAPSGSGKASFCEATPAAIVSLQVGDSVDQPVALSVKVDRTTKQVLSVTEGQQ